MKMLNYMFQPINKFGRGNLYYKLGLNKVPFSKATCGIIQRLFCRNLLTFLQRDKEFLWGVATRQSRLAEHGEFHGGAVRLSQSKW